MLTRENQLPILIETDLSILIGGNVNNDVSFEINHKQIVRSCDCNRVDRFNRLNRCKLSDVIDYSCS
jgi:hypothetical protein